jgi:Kef-type K+ transport system membrane component KefB
LFAPIFFVYVGSSVNVALLNPGSTEFAPQTLIIAGALLVVAIIGKLASGFVVGWGQQPLNHWAIGVGMVPRGEVGLIFAHLGLANAVVNVSTFNALVIVVMLTTFVAPPLLKLLFKTSTDTAEESA